MKALFVYSDHYPEYSMGDHHPMKLIRLKLTHDLIRAYGLLDHPDAQLANVRPADEAALSAIHTSDYLEALKLTNPGVEPPHSFRFGLGTADCPVVPGIWDVSLLSTGATLQCAEAVEQGSASVAFNIAGGLHHAQADHASGFCYLNDPAIAIQRLVEQGYRVAYIDIDAHHGDGVQALFYDTDRVLTISLHESGHFLFPGTGFEHEIGRGVGEGYSVNVPFLPYTDDQVFCWAFREVVPPFVEAFQPDIVVTQLGCDSFRDDPITHLELTTNGFCEMVETMKALSDSKWIALGGGGYQLSNVARAWTLAWAMMLNVELPDELPVEFLEEVERSGVKCAYPEFRDLRRLRDDPHEGRDATQSRRYAERIVKHLLDHALPKVKSA